MYLYSIICLYSGKVMSPHFIRIQNEYKETTMKLTDFNIIKEYPSHREKKGHKIQIFDIKCPKCEKIYKLKVWDNIVSKKYSICSVCIATKYKDSSKSRLYRIWNSMKNRVKGRNKKDHIIYTSKQITICDEWLNDYTKFRDWSINNGYEDSLQIDRIDNDSNYTPENCRWVTQTIQLRNTRKIRSTNTSGYRGVSYEKRNKRWRASITVLSKKISLGSFLCKIDAAKARDKYIVDNNLEHTLNFG